MSSKAFERMRLQSHAYIRQQMDYYQQRLLLVSKRLDKKRTCKYNARSAFLLCAVNPSGSCAECTDYQPESD
ncbi:MAG: DUF6464 family protein [Oscillatoria sp. PMC 1051.18]|uniref:DUF6464 family protein n=1 Tax=Oscillatoria salina TaxID=331517 RepID=UPI0013BC6BFD|nr:DUF6464 family protein [Oscillatoria salina]MBZ8181961.1 hypothetical protein [Oscillatoria salina IIICB1]MEC4893763.1 DUF6464 family protein [Oscillatoria sp. PMC 1050.18]MEC5030467.1 DUF6464 family protein [Oscillatoria sp. PMC 1051.18]NET89341.1 hypothetical protein [Kamptonema sp. SIO1D9]